MSTRTIFLLPALLLLSFMATAQTYTVVDIRGEAVRTSDGKTIAQGEQLKASDVIEYGDNTIIGLCSPEKGRNIIEGKEAGDGEVSKLARKGVASVTAESPEKFKSDSEFKAYFSPKKGGDFYNGHFVVIGDMTWYEVDDEKYPQDGSHFFFVRYVYEDRSVNKGLPFDRSEFALDREELYSSNGEYLVKDQDKIESGEFVYYNGEEYRVLCEFTPYFITKDELKKVIGLMKPWLETRGGIEQVASEVQAMIADLYGKAGRGDVRQFILRNAPEVIK